ncbi:ATP-dependent DNA helicase RecG [Sulfuritortus calidifontis]|uniref:ATP-dependent DNA helicase RecG n=1 Tax=Sulfuritortus calidifontis TaxID=1914471 RepID=A0A4R3JWI4_9PROT|nr:ATP-dependent DNA helicase RecG [Sulfuritortus calidifontis]TCS72678.1 ATP-dependent DNA helicase RecG [Sulfuritortus calidifontis]
MPAKAAEVHEKLGYARAAELILHLPLRYEDETRLTPIRDLRPGLPALVEGVVAQADVQYRPRRQLVVEVRERADEDDALAPTLFFRLLHFYPNQLAQLKPGNRIRLFGEPRQGFHGLEMVHPRYRLVQPGTPLADCLTPVYPSVAGLSQTAIRKAIAAALREADLSELLPATLLTRLKLSEFEPALRRLHTPPPEADLFALDAKTDPAWQRLKFDELLAQQLALKRYALARHRLAALPLKDERQLIERYLARLPFAPTGAQRRAMQEILHDLAGRHPMNRLLQGDVGSGKTLVAAVACLAAVGSGQQAAVMAPTEILAEQHYLKFRDWLEPLRLKVVWLAAALKGRAKREALDQIADGSAQVVVGTHALFQEGVEFHGLALAVVDEQHRFGVAQRLALRHKGQHKTVQPHLLMLSATPIPRSLAMSYLADLDVSVIDELPPGRTPVTTKLIAMARRAEVIERLRHYCADGAQAYWVCPLIEESQKLELKAALDTFEEMQAALPELKVGLVHGRMKAEEKAAVMAAFKAGAIQLLVATTVIEVGVDVPNASLMVIDHAERMGLAQLHQLRGRVGRGSRESTCLLLYAEPLSDLARQRLKIIRDSQDGFAIAREDLKLRGPGEFLGARQSGLPLLRFADLENDVALLEAARDAADELLKHDPVAVKRHLERWLPQGAAFLLA